MENTKWQGTTINVGMTNKIVHHLYTTKEEAEQAFKPVSMLKGNSEYWIVELFNSFKKFYIVCPKDTFYILRRSEFHINNERFEVQRYK